MIEARRRMLSAALSELARPAAIWMIGAAQAAVPSDLAELLSLQPRLSLREGAQKDADPLLPAGRYPVYGMSLAQEPAARGNRFVGFPTGFSLDAFVDELLALTRGASLSSPLARETLRRLQGRVRVRVYTSPG